MEITESKTYTLSGEELTEIVSKYIESRFNENVINVHWKWFAMHDREFRGCDIDVEVTK